MPAHTAVVVVEGVLAGVEDDDDLVRAKTLAPGFSLVAGLAAHARLVLVSSYPLDKVSYWLRFVATMKVRYERIETVLDDQVVPRMRAAGEAVTLYLDTDPDRVAAALREGAVGVLVAFPAYSRVAHRPELVAEGRTAYAAAGLRRSWSSLVEESHEQRKLRGAIPMSLEED